MLELANYRSMMKKGRRKKYARKYDHSITSLCDNKVIRDLSSTMHGMYWVIVNFCGVKNHCASLWKWMIMTGLVKSAANFRWQRQQQWLTRVACCVYFIVLFLLVCFPYFYTDFIIAVRFIRSTSSKLSSSWLVRTLRDVDVPIINFI